LNKPEKVTLDLAVNEIIENPEIGDLAGVRVFKYKHNAKLYLLAYEHRRKELILTLIKQAAHENFYRDLKR